MNSEQPQFSQLILYPFQVGLFILYLIFQIGMLTNVKTYFDIR